MADERINLGGFEINTDDLVSNLQQTKRDIDALTASNKALRESGQQTSQTYIQNEAAIKRLRSEYNSQRKVLSQFVDDSGQALTVQNQLDEAMNREANTIAQLREQNAELRNVRNNVNLETAEGQQQLQQINEQLDRNNETIKENVSEQEQQRLSVGGYSDAIKEAINSTGVLGGAQQDLTRVYQSFSPLLKTTTLQVQENATAMFTAAAGTEGMSTAQKAATITTRVLTNALKLFRLALISTGIGAIVVALGALIAYFATTQAGIDAVNRVLVPLRSGFEAVLGALQRFGEVLSGLVQDNIQRAIRAFEALGQVGSGVIKILTGDFREGISDMEQGANDFNETVIEGVRETASAYKDFADDAVESFQQGLDTGRQIQALTEQIEQSEAELVLTRAEQNRILQEQRNIAQDVNNTTEERQAAALAALDASEKIADAERNILDLKIQQEELQQTLNDSGREDLQTLNQLRADRETAEAANARRQREVQSQLNSIRTQGEQQALQAIQDRIALQQEELELFQAQQGFRAQDAAEEIRLAQEVADRKQAILQEQLDANLISQTKFNTEVLKLNNDLAQRQAEIAVDNANRELETLTQTLEERRNSEEFLTEARAEEFRRGIQLVAEAERQFQETRLNEGLITEQEFQDELNNIRLQKDSELRDLQRDRDAAAQEEKMLQNELEIEALEERNENQFEIENAFIEQQRERDLEAARRKYTDEVMLANAIGLINAQADRAQAQLAVEKDATILESRAKLAGGIAQIIGEETAVGRAAAVAEIALNTASGIMRTVANLGMPLAIPFVAATGALGAVQAATALGVEFSNPGISKGLGQASQALSTGLTFTPLEAAAPFADGGMVKSNMGIPIRRSNGDNRLATLKVGETVLTPQQTSFVGGDMLRLAGVPGFATGGSMGQPSRNPSVINSLMNSLNVDLTDIVADAVEQGAQRGTFSGSQQGITRLSTDSQIRRNASF